MKKKKGLNIVSAYITVGIFPMILAIVIITILSVSKTNTILEEQTYNSLYMAAKGLEQYYGYEIRHGNEIPYEHDYVDSLKEDNVELTLFVGDVRFITSIEDSDNSTGRNENTTASSEIWETVKKGEIYKDSSTQINGRNYYVCYIPLYDTDNNVAGMAFAGTPSGIISNNARNSVSLILLVSIILTIVFGFIVFKLGNALKGPITRIIAITGKMAEGNLNSEIDFDSKLTDFNSLITSVSTLQTKFKEILGELNGSITKMDDSVTQVKELSNKSKLMTENVASAIDEVAIGASSQAEYTQNAQQSVLSIGASIDEVTNEARNLTEAVNSMNEIKTNTIDTMDKLLNITDETSIAIDNIKKQSDETNTSANSIFDAVSLISSIAAQTNLLSLNASIEAARAGEAGKGFAVVANEIRDLADQSASGAQTITEIVNGLVLSANDTLEKAVNLADQSNIQKQLVADTKSSFEELGQSINVTSSSAEIIEKSVERIDKDKVELVNMIEELSSISEENAASAEETTSSATLIKENLNIVDEEVVGLSNISNDIVTAMSFFE